MERAAPHILQSSTKKTLKVQNKEFSRQRFCGENSYIQLISLPTTRELRKMRHRQSTTEILKQREILKRFKIKNKIYKKPVSDSQL